MQVFQSQAFQGPAVLWSILLGCPELLLRGLSYSLLHSLLLPPVPPPPPHTHLSWWMGLCFL